MANRILLKKSGTPNQTPSLGSLLLGEFAVNTYDGLLYSKKNVSGVDALLTFRPEYFEFGTNKAQQYLRVPGGVNGQKSGIAFSSTFENIADMGPRRSADIWSGFNGAAWGSEYLSFGVGGGNDTYGVTTERMRLTATGLGVKTSSPQTALHVYSANAGTPTTTGTATTGVTTRFQNSSFNLDFGTLANGTCFIQPRALNNNATNFNLLLNPNGGNVGIGSLNAAYKLDVVGDINFTGTLRKNGVEYGGGGGGGGGGWLTSGNDIHNSNSGRVSVGTQLHYGGKEHEVRGNTQYCPVQFHGGLNTTPNTNPGPVSSLGIFTYCKNSTWQTVINDGVFNSCSYISFYTIDAADQWNSYLDGNGVLQSAPFGLANAVKGIPSMRSDLGEISASAWDGYTYNLVYGETIQTDGTWIPPSFNIAATSIVSGKTYKIVSVGTTNYTLIGSPNNSVGTVFKSTGVGAGTGIVDYVGSFPTGKRFVVCEPESGHPYQRPASLGGQNLSLYLGADKTNSFPDGKVSINRPFWDTGPDIYTLSVYGRTSPEAVAKFVYYGSTSGGATIKAYNGFSTSPIYSFWFNDTTGIGNPASNTISLINNGVESLRANSNNTISIGTTATPTYLPISIKSSYHANVWAMGPTSPDGNFLITQNSGSYLGVVLPWGATAWSATSDETLKDILYPIVNAIDKLSNVRTVIGRYKTDEVEKTRSFLIAQDWEEILPEAVSKNGDGTLLLSYQDTIPMIISAVKELIAEVKQLKEAIL